MADRSDPSSSASSDEASFVSSVYVGMSDLDSEAQSMDSQGSPDIIVENGNVLPYQFEPQYLVEQLEELDLELENRDRGNENEDRLHDLSWCTCGHCQIMPMAQECICCDEVVEVANKLEEVAATHFEENQPSCITDTDAFHAVCLNRWVLQTAWFQYRTQYQQHYNGPEHKQNRHVAYRQLARWCWGFLGREVRVVLPACAVCCIRANFPPPGNEEEFGQHEFVGYQDVN